MKKIVIGIFLVLILVAVYVLNSTDDNLRDETVADTKNTQNVEVSSDEGIDEEKDNNQQTENPTESTIAGLYTKFDNNLNQYQGKDVVLFFKAEWCPSCRILDSDIKASLTDIPKNVVLLELNYDTETELKKKYGVTTQHTLVQVDIEGNMIKKWSGGNSLEDLLEQVS